jgi:hypothetical protein
MDVQTIDLFKHHAIIPPPENKDIFRKKRLIIDSRDRNTTLYPNPNKYTIRIDEGLQDVVSIELAISDFPFNEYNITPNNNILHISNEPSGPNVTYIPVEIPPGRYDGPELSTTIATEISAVFPNTAWDVQFNSNTSKITLSSSNTAFSLNFKNTIPRKFDEIDVYDYMPRSIGRILGFSPEEYTTTESSPFKITAPYPVDLRNESYIIMFLSRAKIYLSQNNASNQCFAILRLENNDKWLSTLNTEPVRKSFTPPIPDLSSLRFKFVDYYGNAYDFQNKEHRFELIVTMLKQGRKYTDDFSFNS